MSAETKPNLKKIVTHSGNFHTDEVFACAALSILHDGAVEIVRSRDPEVWTTGDYVVDVGGIYDEKIGRFDHHQIGGAGERKNTIPYSSFGLVWKAYGESLTHSAYAARVIDENLVQPIDAGDNGIETFIVKEKITPYLLHDVIKAFRPAWNENRTDDEGFFEACELARTIIEREIIHAHGGEEANRHVEEAYDRAEDKHIILLDGQYPWYETIASHTEPLYVVKQRKDDNNWAVDAVRNNEMHAFKYRKDLPFEWAGKHGQELARVSGVPDALFCHNKLFIAIAGSKEGALELARRAVEA